MCPAALATFDSKLIPPTRVKAGGSRERPQRLPFTRGRRFVYTGIIEPASRWVLRGSRPFPRVSAILASRRSSRSRLAHAEAAPLQALETNTLCVNVPTCRGGGPRPAKRELIPTGEPLRNRGPFRNTLAGRRRRRF